MKSYNVWVEIEEVPDDDSDCRNLELPDKLGRFDTLEDAAAFVRALPGWENDAISAAHPESVKAELAALAENGK